MRDKDILDLHEKIINSEGAKILKRLDFHNLTFGIYKKNYTDLARWVCAAQNGSVLFEIKMQENGVTNDVFLEETLRYLLNFLAGAKSLVDHTRNFMDGTYCDTEMHHMWTNKIEKDVRCCGIIKFMHDLRNYALHRKLPLVGLNVTCVVGGNSIDKSIFINIHAMKDWIGWTSKSKKYINELGDAKELLWLIEEYDFQIDKLYRWFYESLVEFHTQDIKAFMKLQDKWKSLVRDK